jgi:hypothetical protein
MNSIEQYQHHLKRQNEVIVASASDLAKHIQAIATAHADYAKRSFKDGAAFFERLASAKSLEEAMEVRTEYKKLPTKRSSRSRRESSRPTPSSSGIRLNHLEA